jgi:3-hydroxyisobutyrate dehydrogenase
LDLNTQALAQLEEKGAKIGSSAKEVAGESDIVVTMLPDSAAVQEVVLGEQGVIHGVRSDSIVVDMSTIEPSVSKNAANALKEKGVPMLDAPVSGGTMGAEAGTLAIMVGGDEEAYNKCLEIFQIMGKNIYYCGPSGNGETVKIINNMLFGVNMTAVAEALALGVKAGVEMKTLYDVIQSSSGQNWAMQVYYANKGFKGDFEPGFMADLLYKDLGLGMNLSKEEKVPVPVGELCHRIFKDIHDDGLGKKDCSIRLQLMENLLNVKLRLE